MATKQLVILSPHPAGDNGLAELGSRRDVFAQLAAYNTAAERDGDDMLYGPGIRIEVAADDPVRQMLLTINDEEIAWQVIMRIGRELRWKLFDPATGRELAC